MRIPMWEEELKRETEGTGIGSESSDGAASCVVGFT